MKSPVANKPKNALPLQNSFDYTQWLMDDLLFHTFQFLDIPSLLRTAQVNKRWRALANSDELWKIIISRGVEFRSEEVFFHLPVQSSDSENVPLKILLRNALGAHPHQVLKVKKRRVIKSVDVMTNSSGSNLVRNLIGAFCSLMIFAGIGSIYFFSIGKNYREGIGPIIFGGILFFLATFCLVGAFSCSLKKIGGLCANLKYYHEGEINSVIQDRFNQYIWNTAALEKPVDVIVEDESEDKSEDKLEDQSVDETTPLLRSAKLAQ